MSDTVHTSMLEPVRRIEVFTGAGRRRTWSAEEKARIIAESYGDGETVSSVARRHGLTSSQLFWWRREARRAGSNGEAIGFAPVKVEAAARAKRDTAALSSEAARRQEAKVEIVFGPAVVRVWDGADPGTLAAVLAAFKRLTV